MKTTDKIDAARIDLLLGELRLPGIKVLIWGRPGGDRDKGKAGPPPASWRPSPNRRWWSGAAVASNGIWRKRDCRRERPSTRSTSPQCSMISKARVQALAAGDAWLEKGANLLCFGHPCRLGTTISGGRSVWR